MNLKKILLLSVFICLSVCLGACNKRDKLADATVIVQIEPAGDIGGEGTPPFNVGDTKGLRAIIKNVNMEEIDRPVMWSVSPSNLGVFDSSTSKTVVFTAKESGTGKISLHSQGVVTTINVKVE